MGPKKSLREKLGGKKTRVKRTAKALVKRMAMGACDQCDMPIRWKNPPGHYANKHKAVYAETWKNRSSGQLIDHVASVLIKKRYEKRLADKAAEEALSATAEAQAPASCIVEGEAAILTSSSPTAILGQPDSGSDRRV